MEIKVSRVAKAQKAETPPQPQNINLKEAHGENKGTAGGKENFEKEEIHIKNTADMKMCPIEYTISLINGKWKIGIVKELSGEAVRYGALVKSIPNVSAKVLIQQLRELEDDGIVKRTIYPEVPPRVEYGLTEKGRSIYTVFIELRRWGLAAGSEDDVACKNCQKCVLLH